MLKTLNLAILSNFHTIDLSSIQWCPSQGPHKPYIETFFTSTIYQVDAQATRSNINLVNA